MSNDNDALRKPEQQAHEPEVVAWRNPIDSYSIVGVFEKDNNVFQYSDEFLAAHDEPLITLQSHREAMAKAHANLIKANSNHEEFERRWYLAEDAIAKKDAALRACIDSMLNDKYPVFSNAITQAKEALK